MKLKKLLKNNTVQYILSKLVYWYLKLVYKTTKWSHINFEEFEKLKESNTPFIVCFWHGHLAMMPFAWQAKKNFFMLVSQHGDAQFIAKVVHHANIQTIHGSTNRGGADAARILLKKLKEPCAIGITPDGPRGPKGSIAPGIVKIAQWSGCPIICLSIAMSRKKLLSSWDRFLLPLPFSKATFAASAPLFLPKDSIDMETLSNLIADTLNKAQIMAEETIAQR